MKLDDLSPTELLCHKLSSVVDRIEELAGHVSDLELEQELLLDLKEKYENAIKILSDNPKFNVKL